jgi:arabinose-5-phosphate isomerase
VSEDVAYGQEVIRAEARALVSLVDRLDESFAQAVDLVLTCRGRVVTTGMGKAGIVGEKISATLASTGTPSLPLHPAEAFHGDLGRIVKDDVVLAISNSGETAEIVQLVPELRKIGACIIAITGSRESSLARHADVVLNLGHIEEACPLGLAPSCSTTAMLALGDALALAVLKRRKLSKEDFARYHPAGDLGRQLLTVEEVMRTGPNFPVVGEGTSVEEALRAIAQSKDRTGSVAGSVCVVNAGGRLAGIFTDGDLRRHLLSDGPGLLKRAIKEVMTRGPRLFIRSGRLATEALRIMAENQVDELPVVDEEFHPLGNIDIQDLLQVGLVLSTQPKRPRRENEARNHDQPA